VGLEATALQGIKVALHTAWIAHTRKTLGAVE